MSEQQYMKRTIIKEIMFSTFLNEERSIRIYLPPGFNELISYPIVYAQDGQDIFMFGRIATMTNELILDRGMEPIIIVGVDVLKKDRTSEYSSLGGKNEDYKRFFAEELVPFIEEKFAVRENGLKRILIGDSLGATVSLDLALDYPQLFSNVISLSGAFFSPTVAKLKPHSNLNWMNLWMIIGTEETNVETHLGVFNFVEWNRKVKALLEQKETNLTYLEKKGTHIWGFWQRELPEGLLHFCNRQY
jgi:enterochelin esterase-like enzyme